MQWRQRQCGIMVVIGFLAGLGGNTSAVLATAQIRPRIANQEDVHFSCAADFSGWPVLALVAHSGLGRHATYAFIVAVAARPLASIPRVASKAVKARRVAAACTKSANCNKMEGGRAWGLTYTAFKQLQTSASSYQTLFVIPVPEHGGSPHHLAPGGAQ